MKTNTEKPRISFLRFVVALAGLLLGGPVTTCGHGESSPKAKQTATNPVFALLLLANQPCRLSQ